METTRLRPLARSSLAVLAVAGLLLPWYFNLAYFAGGGSVAPAVFFRDAFANSLTTAITADVYLAALAFSVGVAADRRMSKARWLAIPVCFGIGLAVALPLYLLWRARPARVSEA
jgi:MFS-type transporter involved in bile tolerance (Atg22 family)